MGTFNLEDKVTFNELAPSLQQMLDGMVTQVIFNQSNTVLQQLQTQLGPNRISITANPGSIPNPQNGQELLISMADNIPYSYNNGWVPMGGVYS